MGATKTPPIALSRQIRRAVVTMSRKPTTPRPGRRTDASRMCGQMSAINMTRPNVQPLSSNGFVKSELMTVMVA